MGEEMVRLFYGKPPGWVDKYKNNTLHLVCAASLGRTMCDLAASRIGRMKQTQEVWPLTMRVNIHGETGTFWPLLPLTVVPQLSWPGRHAPVNLDEFLLKCFLDVAEANRDLVRLPDLFVDLNPYGGDFDKESAMPIARDTLAQEGSIKNIWFG